jgi:transcriptional regulator with XRE-family HTH domain
MGKIENDELRKIKNAHFIRAFEYVAQRKEMNQTQLASAIGSKTAYISVYRNGTRPVPEETIDALIRISATIEKGNGQIYKPYLLGLSDYMLLRNVPSDELADSELRKSDPDYDLIKARRESKEKEIEETIIRQSTHVIDPSSALNAALAAQASEIMTLKQTIADMKEAHNRELNDKEAHITTLKNYLKEKEDHIVTLKSRVAELRRIIDANNYGLPNYPFPQGVAEHPQKSVK